MIDGHLRRQLRRPHRWLAQRFRPRAAVLMYHGIGRVGIDPWGLFVSPENFAQHLRVLNELTNPTTLDGLSVAASGGRPVDRAVAVTFDDGYANVLHEAEPILAANGVPATLFVISDPVASASEYWWDELAGLILVPGSLPDRLHLEGPGVRIRLDTGPAAHYDEAGWQRDHDYRDEEGPASPRMQLYRTLWAHLAKLEEYSRQKALDALADSIGRARAPRDSHRSLTLDELVRLDGDVVSIGGHTSTHPLLPEIDPARQRVEVEGNRAFLRDVLDRHITSFSYPFGANDPSSVEAVRAAGYPLAVTTRPETVPAGVDPLRIGRFDVKDWTGQEFERRLRSWFRFR
ncbi:MAG: polysaccharide deacetylase family protein [Actinomycetota bacterium]